jgi:hypothetical protein
MLQKIRSGDVVCHSALNNDPLSASKIDPSVQAA